MNYRHTFHAGNFGDASKHALLVPLVRAMQRKPKGFVFVDTHAGIGGYDLSTAPAGRTLEFESGIGRLWRAKETPDVLREFLDLVRRYNEARGAASGELRCYPGSPRIVEALLRPQDRLALSELHPEDFEVLRAAFRGKPGVSVQRIDAYSAIRAFLPPPERRALILIDPPYEDANEVSRLHAGLEAGLRRLPAGTFAIWFPIKDRSASEAFKAVLQTLPLPPTLSAELTVRPDKTAGRLNGSGLLIVNPPWQIERELEAVLSALLPLLATEPGARAGLEWLVEEE
ncbi:MAG: 23S rRNA (adenine(2030)-N(6))-methyltransferase RlmJ [Opitutaceae bacterium]